MLEADRVVFLTEGATLLSLDAALGDAMSGLSAFAADLEPRPERVCLGGSSCCVLRRCNERPDSPLGPGMVVRIIQDGGDVSPVLAT